MKILKWIGNNILLLITLFLLAFIPLYPKIPLIDIKNTWVYIRAEDFLVVLALIAWLVQLARGKVSLKTPLTIPIILFWIIGGVATIHAVLIIFPTLPSIFPNVAFLSFLRRIEYLSLFFIAFAAMRDKRFIPYVIVVLVLTLLLVIGYGIGQRYLGFNAYLTMNEEFAKGIPIKLSPLSRVPSTFGGHYDLAAYLVLIIPILASLIFGFRNWLIRLCLLASIGLGFILLFMTVSRVSFFVLLVSLLIVLFLQKASFFANKKKFVLFFLAISAVLLVFFSLNFSKGLQNRFGNTVREIDVLVEATTGQEIGQVKNVETHIYKDKIILQRSLQSREDLVSGEINNENPESATRAAQFTVVPFKLLPEQVVAVVPPNTSTGENLPQGTAYINLSLSPVIARPGDFFYEKPLRAATQSAYVVRFTGNFVIKRASAYDLSFTTRFQGEWPNAVKAFKRSVLFGSGYSSIGLAIDNSFLRMLGEVGIVGLVSFLAIFVFIGIYIRKILPEVDSPVAKGFILGYVAGLFGLALNAVFIDVFEASKIAYLLWLLTGVTIGILHLYRAKNIALLQEFKKVITSQYAVITYICIAGTILFSPMMRNYYVGDDFTWLAWAADCSNSTSGQCSSFLSRIVSYFTHADGFFYRPGTKIYFLVMYSLFWFNQGVYHFVSISLHIITTALLYLIARRILKNNTMAALTGLSFLVLSGYSEAVFWISATGFLFTACFALLSLLFFAVWEEKRKTQFYIASFISLVLGLLFHELGIVIPLLLLVYKVVDEQKFELRKILKNSHYALLFLPSVLYLGIRFAASSHWFSGDYSYNLIKLPLNTVGNLGGYLMLSLFGPIAWPIYNMLRESLRANLLIPVIVLGTAGALVFVYLVVHAKGKIRNLFNLPTRAIQKIEMEERKIILFGTLFFIIALLPFLGLGNITSRYSYLASAGFIVLFVHILKKLYGYLLKSGREITYASIALVLAIFYLLHIIQIQQIHTDWYEAGRAAEKFIIGIDASYRDYWSREQMKFHFVNVPIRHGDAWVFPVGLPDALWIIFRNPNIQVNQHLYLKDALNAVDAESQNEKVFLFDNSGNVTPVKKPKGLGPIESTDNDAILKSLNKQ